jgi:hypothetical protein
MLKIVLSFFVFTFSLVSLAEPKMLTCSTTSTAEIERLAGFVNEPDASQSTKKHFNDIIKRCLGSGFGHKKIFTFDTLGLNNAENSKIEVMESTSCGVEPTDVIAGTLQATPNVITFKYHNDPLNHFNVDRKSLIGGRHTLRDFKCILKDIDTSQNLL